MGYEVLSDELYKDDKKGRKSKKKSSGKLSIKPIYIHLLIIIIIFGFLAYYFLNFHSSKKDVLGNINLVGGLSKFNKTYSGNLSFYSQDFTLKTKDTFMGTSKNFFIDNFSGNIYLQNKSIVFEGTGSYIKYDSNIINISNSHFKLISDKKTNFNAYFKELSLSATNGELKVDNSLTYSFTNSSIEIHDINSSINYDGTFSVSGIAKEFNFTSDENKIQILFKNG